MEFPSPLILTWFVVNGVPETSPVTWLLVTLWWVHYLNRSIIYPLRIRHTTTRMPVTVVALGIMFHVFNGYIVGYALGHAGNSYDIAWLNSPQFLVGGCLFILGMVLNIQSDNILLRAKKAADGAYVIPQGGLFRYVSAPNYLGEIIEWTGFAVMAWSVPALSFALWTAANLVPRALAHHRWYLEKFEDYPSARRALVPFLL